MKYSLSTRFGGLIICAVSLSFTNIASAADWLTLQGTEPAGAANPVNIWGFVQAQYQDDNSDSNAADQYVPAKLIGPDLDSQSQFNVNRARLGVRGVAMPLDSQINYFLLAEFGNNGITDPENSSAKLTDASITFNHVKGARVRVGLFKTPGAEEGLQAIHVFDYINFTNVTNQMLLERFPNRRYTPNVGPQTITPENDFNGFEESVGAFRDVGVQVFNTFKLNNGWEASYAAMLGNGNGLNFGDNDDNKELYLYVAGEKVFSGKGPRRNSLKLFAWSQDGKRTADFTGDTDINGAPIHNPEEYDRERRGAGFKYLNKPWRVTAEYMEGEGMIMQGVHNPSFGIGPCQGNPTSTAGCHGAKAEAKGYYVEAGYRIPSTNWELDARFDNYQRLDGDKFEAEYDKLTLGAQYFFNPRVRVAFNYEISDAEAPNFDSGKGPNANLDGIENRFSVQITAIFKQ